ncbi:MAG: hypothetical protein HQK49_03920 [Oligoflexia bacterium]|nr:hypothetical protein [Oligoflexia bacterium]
MMIINKTSSKVSPFLIVIFLVALSFGLFFRLYYLDYMEFKGDESWILGNIVNFAKGGDLPSTVVSSIGIPCAPFLYYILLPIAIFTQDLHYLVSYIAILNIMAAILAVYVFASWSSYKTSLLAISLYLLSPWGIIFSRKLWAPDLIFPLMMFFYFLLAIFSKTSSNYITQKIVLFISSILVLSFASQMHPSILFFMISFFISMILFNKEYREIISYKVILLLALAILVPASYLIIQQAKIGFPIVAQLSLILKNWMNNINFNIMSFHYSYSIMTGIKFKFLMGSAWEIFKEEFPFWKFAIVRAIFLFQILLSFSGVIILLSKIRIRNFSLVINGSNGSKETYLAQLAVASILFVIAMGFSGVGIYPHYFIVLYPLQFVFAAFTITYLYEKILSIRIKSSYYLLVSLFIIASIHFNFNFYNFIIKNNGIDISKYGGDYGPTNISKH